MVREQALTILAASVSLTLSVSDQLFLSNCGSLVAPCVYEPGTPAMMNQFSSRRMIMHRRLHNRGLTNFTCVSWTVGAHIIFRLSSVNGSFCGHRNAPCFNLVIHCSMLHNCQVWS